MKSKKNSNKEKWTVIYDYESYKISTHGRIKNIKTNRLMRFFNNGGYLRIGLCKGNIQKKFLVHRLVLENFIGLSPINKQQTRHLDGNKHNNQLENLQWGNNQENQIDCLKHDCRQTKLKEYDIPIILQALQEHNCRQVAQMFNVHPKTINDVKLRKTWRHVS